MKIRSRRTTVRQPTAEFDLYVAKKSNAKAQLKRALEVLTRMQQVRIHGLGANIMKACQLALQVKEKSSFEVKLETTTATVGIVDDVFHADLSMTSESRSNSSVCITISKHIKPQSITAFIPKSVKKH